MRGIALTSFVLAFVVAPFALVWGAQRAGAAQAQPTIENVCLVVYGNGEDARVDDPKGVAAAAVMPRESAKAITDDYRKIYDYADQQSMIHACQCLQNPAPAYSMAQRDAALKNCPKPTKIEQARELPKPPLKVQ